MLVRGVELKNIRSYKAGNLRFGAGRTLLSGDIGSGKSTILLAIEFALFGLMRGSISGADLLRHGENEGSVTLSFSLKNNNYVIHRALRRTSTGISQEAGYLETNENRESLVHTELKARILDILGYPSNLLSKSKNLIFRYTSYTPQEEVKRIMYESADARLDIVRKLFGTDKYKNIKENSILLSRQIKREEENINAMIDDVEQLKNDLKERDEVLIKLEEEIISQTTIIQSKMNEIVTLKEKNKEVEILVKQEEKKSNREKILENKYSDLLERNKQLQRIIANTIIKEKNQIKDVESFNDKINSWHVKEQETQEKLNIARTKDAKLESEKEIILRNNKQIQQLSTCALCQQEVQHEHKERIEQDTLQQVNNIEVQITKINEYKNKASENLKKINAKIEMLRELKNKNNSLINENRIIDEQLKQKNNYQQELEELTHKMKNVQESVKEIQFVAIDKSEYEARKDKIIQKDSEISENKIRLAEIKKDAEHTLAKQNEMKKQLKNALLMQNKIRESKLTREWLEKYFVKSVNNIEKHVMLKIYHEFNNNFQEWFDMLIEDDTITSRLDETFSPIIIQNGLETSFDNLSGGEKTSLALAYRLALNKVINDFLSNVNTQNLLILDEPTDGFSSHQLDKLREVLDNINAEQLIIVSHEPKLESFVDEIIRIEKLGHESVTV